MRRERHPEDSFILVACDGIFDVLSSDECATYIREVNEERLAETEPLTNTIIEGLFDDIIAEDVQETSDDLGCSDNMSAILIQFTTDVAESKD